VTSRGTRVALVATACGLVACGLYGKTLDAQFVWDDHTLIVRNETLGRLADLWRCFTTAVTAGENVSYYRPILMVSYLVDRQIWGLDPMGFHLTNVLLHGIDTALVCGLAFAYSGSLVAASIGALLFACHPIQAQAVALILGRNDLLLVPPVVGMLLVARYRRAVAPCLLLYATALWTKETGIIAPLLLVISEGLSPRRVTQARIRWGSLTFGFLAIAAVYLGVRRLILGSLIGLAPPLPSDASRGMLVPVIFGYYARHVLLPWSLSPTPYSPALADGAPLVAAIGITLAFAAAVGWILHKSTKMAAGLLFFAIALLPVLGFVPMQVTILEHRTYLPMVGIALFITAAAAERERLATIIAIPLLAGLAFATSARLPIFHDDRSLWATAVERAPGSAYAHQGYGIALTHDGLHDAAVAEFREVLHIDPEFDRARYELALALERAGRRDAAIATIEEQLRLHPKDVAAWNALAYFWKQSEDPAKSEAALRQGLLIEPQNPVLLRNLRELLGERSTP